VGSWERCGNTPYYRRPSGEGWFYANPFNWSQVVVSVENTGLWAGSSMVIYRKAPEYDWDLLNNGSFFFGGGHQQQMEHLRSTHEWANDLSHAKQSRLSPAELRKLFEGIPEEDRARILEGVGALLWGYEKAEMQAAGGAGDLGTGAGPEEVAMMAVGVGTAAFRNLDDLKNSFPDEEFILADTLELATEEALGNVGIHEC
jgi:hypothetical protein